MQMKKTMRRAAIVTAVAGTMVGSPRRWASKRRNSIG